MQVFKAALLCSIALVFVTNLSHAQASKTVILIDGVATEVMLAPDGAIEQVIREIPDYMSGFESGQRAGNAHQQETTRAADASLNPQDPLSSSSYSNRYDDQFSSVGAYRVIFFKSGTALLSNATILKLDEIIEEQQKTGQLVMLNTACTNNDVQTRILSENRVNGCKDYLMVKGVPEGNIVVSIEENYKPSAKINVFLK